MEIKTVSIIGLGALGVLFGNQLLKHMQGNEFRIVASSDRITKYKRDCIYCNGEICNFNYITPQDLTTPADLLIFAVKYNDLQGAITDSKNQVGENTIILSLLNGISSEELIGQAFGHNKVIYSVAQGMDAVKVGNKLTYKNKGMICFGDKEPGLNTSEKVKAVKNFFEKMSIPYLVDTDMQKRQWGKFMLNVGVNQAVAVYECDYGEIKKVGPARDTMILAMKEVIALSEKENVNLTLEDLNYWLSILDGLNPLGKPSMRQDLEAERYSEVELFSGTVLKLAKRHNLPCPTNQKLYDRIKEMENNFC